jgi:hypothetical protein
MVTNKGHDIQTGDTVFISGLYGKKLLYLNNKVAKVINILLSHEEARKHFLAYVELIEEPEDGKKRRHFVNFDFIYKITDVPKLAPMLQESIQYEDNFFQYFEVRNKIIDFNVMYDEHYQMIGTATDIYGRLHAFLISGVN